MLWLLETCPLTFFDNNFSKKNIFISKTFILVFFIHEFYFFTNNPAIYFDFVVLFSTSPALITCLLSSKAGVKGLGVLIQVFVTSRWRSQSLARTSNYILVQKQMREKWAVYGRNKSRRKAIDCLHHALIMLTLRW